VQFPASHANVQVILFADFSHSLKEFATYSLIVLTETGKKLRFGPFRTRAASGIFVIAIVIAVASIRAFGGNTVVAVIALVVAIEFLLVGISLLERSLTLTETGLISQGHVFGVIHRVRFTNFDEIQKIEVRRGHSALHLDGIIQITIYRANVRPTPITAVSRFVNPKATERSTLLFDNLVKDLNNSLQARPSKLTDT
jgi:hypothetical protein